MSRFYSDDRVVAEMTARLVAGGVRILQPFVFDEDADRHVMELLSLLDPPQEASIMDIACGIGEAARLMHKARPDIVFTLQNLSAAQLALCPNFQRLHCDGAAIPLGRKYDCLMLMAALGHFELRAFMLQAAMLLKDGGKFLLYDIFADGDVSALAQVDYRAHPIHEVIAAARDVGLTPSIIAEAPRIRGPHLEAQIPDFGRYFDNVTPAAIVFVKEALQ